MSPWSLSPAPQRTGGHQDSRSLPPCSLHIPSTCRKRPSLAARTHQRETCLCLSVSPFPQSRRCPAQLSPPPPSPTRGSRLTLPATPPVILCVNYAAKRPSGERFSQPRCDVASRAIAAHMARIAALSGAGRFSHPHGTPVPACSEEEAPSARGGAVVTWWRPPGWSAASLGFWTSLSAPGPAFKHRGPW